MSRWTKTEVDPIGLARTVLALGTLGTYLANDTNMLVRPDGRATLVVRNPAHTEVWTLFGMLHDHPDVARWIGILILAVTAIGFAPRVMGILHWWVAVSLFVVAGIPDGGDQVASVLTLLLIPITLVDGRWWHWRPAQATGFFTERVRFWAHLVIRFQVFAIYLNSIAAKSRVAEWTDGTALYYWFGDPYLGLTTEHFHLLLPWLAKAVVVDVATWSVLLIQSALFMAFTFSASRRIWLLPIGLTFHFGIVLAFGLFSLFFSMAAALLLYLWPAQNPIRLISLSLPTRAALPRLLSARAFGPFYGVRASPAGWPSPGPSTSRRSAADTDHGDTRTKPMVDFGSTGRWEEWKISGSSTQNPS